MEFAQSMCARGEEQVTETLGPALPSLERALAKARDGLEQLDAPPLALASAGEESAARAGAGLEAEAAVYAAVGDEIDKAAAPVARIGQEASLRAFSAWSGMAGWSALEDGGPMLAGAPVKLWIKGSGAEVFGACCDPRLKVR